MNVTCATTKGLLYPVRLGTRLRAGRQVQFIRFISISISIFMALFPTLHPRSSRAGSVR